jgi:GT2 family glycosyltransferase
MGWEPDALERLLEVADPVERPVVGALCFGFSPSDDSAAEANGLMRFPFPTIYDLVEEDDHLGFRVRNGYPTNTVQECFATGAAFLLIHRSLLQRMRDEWGDVWFDRVKPPKAKAVWGEDVSFCTKVRTLGVPVIVHAGVRTSHWKPIYVSEAYYYAQLIAPPAREEVDVVVPVLGRPHHAEPFMRTLRASTGLAYATILANAEGDDDQTAAAWEAVGARVIRCAPGRTTFAHKVNDALALTDRPWLLLVGSDVEFTRGWWDHAWTTAQTTGANVVSTNDVLNGDVQAGRLAVHPVMRRSYIMEQGGSWDGPGTIAHEGYRHGYVDQEWSLVARGRGTFAFAPGARIVHLHSVVGRSEEDDTYRLAKRYASLDAETFERRWRRFGRKAAA